MKTLILAAGALAFAAAAANADEIVTKQTTTGVYSAPVAGATPQAREDPAPDTTVLESREKTTVTQVPSTTVIEERAPASRDVEVHTETRAPY